MLKHTILSTEGILILEPSGALESTDFEAVVQDMDPYLVEKTGGTVMVIPAEQMPRQTGLAATYRY